MLMAGYDGVVECVGDAGWLAEGRFSKNVIQSGVREFVLSVVGSFEGVVWMVF